MKDKEIQDLIQQISSNPTTSRDFDYEGFGVIEDMKLTRDDLKKVLEILTETFITLDVETRNSKYLFNNGLEKSKAIFLEQLGKNNTPEFEEKKEIFKNKLVNVEPIIHFITKMKQIL